MLKLIKIILLLFISNSIFCQDKENIYVILDNDDFYEIKKNNDYAILRILNSSYKKNSEKKSNEDIVIVENIPNRPYFIFNSIKKPIKKSNIEEIKTFSVIEVSKENKKVWKKYPYHIIFIEKKSCKNYTLWHMAPQFQE